MNRFKLLLFLVLLLSVSCMVQERACEYESSTIEEIVPHTDNPVLARTMDTLVISRVQSSIQSSPYNLLKGFTVKKDGIYTVSISEEDLTQLHIPVSAFENYCRQLGKINENEQ